jgi:hypothetical protein
MYDHQEPDICDETPPLSSRADSWDVQDRHHSPSQFPAASQFNRDSRCRAEEPRHRRPLHIETDRIASHPTPTHGGSVTLDARRAQQSEERYVDDMYRSRLGLSPSLHHHASFAGHESFSDATRQDYIDDREPFSLAMFAKIALGCLKQTLGRSLAQTTTHQHHIHLNQSRFATLAHNPFKIILMTSPELQSRRS